LGRTHGGLRLRELGGLVGASTTVAVSIAVQCSRKRIAADRALANSPKQEVQMFFDELASPAGPRLWTAFLPVGFADESRNTYENWAKQLAPFFKKALGFYQHPDLYNRSLYIVSNDLSANARECTFGETVGAMSKWRHVKMKVTTPLARPRPLPLAAFLMIGVCRCRRGSVRAVISRNHQQMPSEARPRPEAIIVHLHICTDRPL
jgi:hypothetical protein